MSFKFLVPGVLLAAVIVVPLTLIGILVNSPYTHANLAASFDPAYQRTEVTLLGAPVLLSAGPMAVQIPATAPLEERGKATLVTQGCSGCHGLNGTGGVVAPAIVSDIEVIREMVRKGPGGMPVFSPQDLTDYDITAIAAFLQSQKAKK